MKVLKELYEDAKNIQQKDPAAKHILYVILLLLLIYKFFILLCKNNTHLCIKNRYG